VRNDLGLYDRHGDEWWVPGARAFASLQRVNEYRLRQLEAWCGDWLCGATVVDLGCGGGLLAEPLAARGARVVGVDLSLPSLRCAAARRRPGCRYACGDAARAPLAGASADLVLLADVLEHLADGGAAVAEAARLAKPGGQVFVGTINRTHRARWLAVTLAEGLGLVPRGTHDPDLFVAPDQLRAWAEQHGLRIAAMRGEVPKLWRTVRDRAITFRASRSLAVSYSALLEKRG
jgi:2-polyprenyl-6-hydroxyphenyl methylase/3-demethylubiquinone-9 3-methyltransferase